jgi:hypothetical protein
MNRKLLNIIAILVLIILHSHVSNAQTESFNKDGYKITRTIRIVDDIKVIISQSKSLNYTNPPCTANIRIFKNDIQIDSLLIPGDQFDGVGDRYGLLIYEKPVKNHVIITKFGSYDGKTIIINNKGRKFVTLGGFSSLDSQNGILFSVYHSDTSGLSVFDLNTDKELYSVIMFDSTAMRNERVREFYLYKNEYFVKTDQNNINQWKIWKIELTKKKLVEADRNTILKAEHLKELTDYKGTEISCE